MMAFKHALVLLASVCLVYGQRPSFAGSKPIGFPEVEKTSDPLGNRFGEDLPLPIEAKGDRDLVERISKMPIDQQPFWYINWKALEEQRRNPQTYQQRPNTFIDTNLNQAQNSAPSSDSLTSRFNADTDTSNQMIFDNDNGFSQNQYQYPPNNAYGYNQNRRYYNRF